MSQNSLYEVATDILGELGGNTLARYDSTYEVAKAILAEIQGGGGGGSKVVFEYLTQEQYDTLATKVNSKLYLICTDPTHAGPESTINAMYIGAGKIYPAVSVIDDTTTAADKTWSSNKINTELSGKAPQATTYTKTEVDTLLAGVVYRTYLTAEQYAALTTKNIDTMYIIVADPSSVTPSTIPTAIYVGTIQINGGGGGLTEEDQEVISQDSYLQSSALNQKQPILRDRENIQTINEISILNAGNRRLLTVQDLIGFGVSRMELDESQEVIAEDSKEQAAAIATKQPTLVPGVNIKNINGNSILGAGNLELPTVEAFDEVTDVIAEAFVQIQRS